MKLFSRFVILSFFDISLIAGNSIGQTKQPTLNKARVGLLIAHSLFSG